MKAGKFAGKYNALIFFDCETSGLDPAENQIIELAAVKIRPDGTRDQFDLFAKLPDGETLPDEIVELTGITDAMLQELGEDIDEVLYEFWDLIALEDSSEAQGPVLLIAHNAQFDVSFILKAFEKFNNDLLNGVEVDYLDTLTVFKDRRPYPHRLENAIEKYGLQGIVENSHRAIDDVDALCEVFKAMHNEKGKNVQNIYRYVNLFGFNPKYGISGEEIEGVTYMAQPYAKSNQWPLPWYMTLPGKKWKEAQKNG